MFPSLEDSHPFPPTYVTLTLIFQVVHSQSRSDHLRAQAVSVLKYANSPLPRPWPRKFTVPSKGPLFFYTFSHSPFLSPSFPWTSPVLNIQNNTCAFISLVAFFNALMLQFWLILHTRLQALRTLTYHLTSAPMFNTIHAHNRTSITIFWIKRRD